MSKTKVRLRFEWFEPWFEKHDNFITDFFDKDLFDIEVFDNPVANVDFEFVSVYPPLRRDIQARIHRLKKRLPVWQRDTAETYPMEFKPDTKNFKTRIWYTSENLRPPFQKDFDLFFSFDQDTYGGANFYLPLWQLHIDYEEKHGRPLNPNSALGRQISHAELLEKRELPSGRFEERKFACVFVANPQPTRLRLIEELAKHGDVDVYGLYSGRSVRDKYAIAKNYNFVLCPENDLFPGYVTEKLLDAYMCDVVPLYWGDMGSDECINQKSFLNLAQFSSIEDFCNYVANLDVLSYTKIYNQPLMNRAVDFSRIKEALVSRLSLQQKQEFP
jgi:hypothetical protein